MVINKEHNYFRLKESIRAKNNRLDEIERDRLIKQGKRTEIDEIHRQNERESINLKTDV